MNFDWENMSNESMGSEEMEQVDELEEIGGEEAGDAGEVMGLGA